MSNIDQTAGDQITGADVVDGVLILRRMDGSTTEAPLGGGASVEYPILDWYGGVEDLASGVTNALLTGYATLYDAAGESLQDVATGDLIANGIAVGEDYVLARSGADSLYFRTPGVYVANVANGPTAIADGDSSLLLEYSSAYRGVREVKTVLAGETGLGGGQLVIVVGAADIVLNDSDEPWMPDDVLSDGSSFNMQALHASATPQDVSGEVYISRIL